MSLKEYLGDSVYADTDGYSLILTTYRKAFPHKLRKEL